jgi:DNA-directed RNA polymerase specialized sigma24 family protein
VTVPARQIAADLDALLPAIGAGDADAFGRWLAGAEPPLRAALRSFAATVDVEAVLQETFLRVWQLAPGFVPAGGQNALLRFAHRISRHLCLSELRRRHGETSLDASATVETPDLQAAAPPDPLLRAAILECRERLPGQPAAALAQRLATHGDEPDAVLAQRLGMTLNTFLQNFSRARKLLADCLKKRGVELDLEGGLR